MRPALYGQAYIFLRQIAHLERQRGRCPRLISRTALQRRRDAAAKPKGLHIQGGGVSGTDRHAGLPKLRVSDSVENYFDLARLIRSLQRLESGPCG